MMGQTRDKQVERDKNITISTRWLSRDDDKRERAVDAVMTAIMAAAAAAASAQPQDQRSRHAAAAIAAGAVRRYG